MKFKVFLTVLLALCFYNVYCEEKETTNYSIGFVSSDMLFHGPGIYGEYSGFGKIGLFLKYNYIGYGLFNAIIEDFKNYDISGNGLTSGIKYYIEFDERGHKSLYVSPQIFLNSYDVQDSDIDHCSMNILEYGAGISCGYKTIIGSFFIDIGIGLNISGAYFYDHKNFPDNDDVWFLENDHANPGMIFNVICGIAL